MDKIEKLTKSNLSQEEVDTILDDLITKMHDHEFKESFERKLKEKKINKKGSGEERNAGNNVKRLYTILAIAASLMFVMVFSYFNFSQKSQVQLASEYANVYSISHPGISKGEEIDDIRTRAISYYNNGDYQEALGQFDLIERKTGEDVFFAALSYFNLEEYEEAILQLSQSEGYTQYRQESHFFSALAFILDGQTENGLRLMREVAPDEYGYDAAREILKK